MIEAPGRAPGCDFRASARSARPDWGRWELAPAFPRLRMFARPYSQPYARERAFHWLVREDEPGRHVVLDRGPGATARARIERTLRQLAGGCSPDAQRAARALHTGWEIRW